MAESYAQLRVRGMHQIVIGIRFPIQGGYVAASQLGTEGAAVGNIVLGGAIFMVRVGDGSWEALRQ